MIKICDSALVKPLSIIFHTCIKSGSFPYTWKKSNVTPVHKKKMINNSLIAIGLSLYFLFLEKTFERIIFNNIYKYLDEHNFLILTNQDLDQKIHVFTSY